MYLLCQQFLINSKRVIMNIKLIIFCGCLSGLIGMVFGITALEIGNNKYESKFDRELDEYYALVGASIGFAVGATQECIREIKQQRDKAD